ncbi:MAG: hypothetical protein HQ538_00845 [Parcubacteria group bacterium]|nr:hypothetical protein [Parcubacteria group bacterium]
MKKVTRMILRIMIGVLLLITFLFLLNLVFIDKNNLAIVLSIGWFLVALISWTFPNWLD